MHKTTFLCQFGLILVTSLLTHISINSQPFLVGIISESAQDHDMGMDQELYRFRAIIGHQGPLLASDQNWKEANIMFKLKGRLGRLLFEPLSIIAADDPVTCVA